MPHTVATSKKTHPQIAMHIQKEHHKRTPRSVIVFLLVFFPPLAWFFMMMDKTYHHWLVKVIFISGLVSLAFLSFVYLTIGVQLNELYTTLGLQDVVNQELTLASMWSGALFAILQVIFAIYCHHYLKHHGKLHTTQLVIVTIILVSALIIAIIPPLIMIQAIYVLTSSV